MISVLVAVILAIPPVPEETHGILATITPVDADDLP
jgi:hypothetical protein